MMFGLKRKLALQAVIDNVRPLIGIFQQYEGIPVGFWQDRYVLGFISMLIVHHMNLASSGSLTNSNLSTEDKGRVLIETFTTLSNINGIEITRNYRELLAARDPEFLRGSHNAAVTMGYATNNLANEDAHPGLMEAKNIAARMGKAGDRTQIGSLLMMELFYNEVQKRFKRPEG
jgi:hypothetical protein